MSRLILLLASAALAAGACVKYPDRACGGRSELLREYGHTEATCRAACASLGASCAAFEIHRATDAHKGLCQLSSTCTHELSASRAHVDLFVCAAPQAPPAPVAGSACPLNAEQVPWASAGKSVVCSTGTEEERKHTSSHTQRDDVFLKGAYVELGMSSWGYYGTHTEPPPHFVSYSMRKDGTGSKGLSAIADHHKDGWDRTKHVLNFAGDFAMPGSPHESWMVGFDKSGRRDVQCAGRANSGRCRNTLSCTIADQTSVGAGLLQATSVCENNDIRVTHVASFGADQLFVRTQVKVEALAPGITNVRYMRNVDPDNDRNSGRGYSTVNKVVAQYANGDGYSAVAASSSYGTDSYFALYTKDTRSYVRYGGFHNTDPYARDFDEHASTFKAGATRTADQAIDLMLKLGDLAKGSTGAFDFYYVMDKTLEAHLREAVHPACVRPAHDCACRRGTYGALTVDGATGAWRGACVPMEAGEHSVLTLEDHKNCQSATVTFAAQTGTLYLSASGCVAASSFCAGTPAAATARKCSTDRPIVRSVELTSLTHDPAQINLHEDGVMSFTGAACVRHVVSTSALEGTGGVVFRTQQSSLSASLTLAAGAAGGAPELALHATNILIEGSAGFAANRYNPCPKNECACPNGVAVHGLACKRNGDPMCRRCIGAFHLARGDTACEPNVCHCPNGAVKTGAACTAHDTEMCDACRDGFHLDGVVCKANRVCTATEHETVAPTGTSDRVCKANSRCHEESDQYESVAPTATSDRRCRTHTVCASWQYVSLPATNFRDRECATCTTCKASEYISRACGAGPGGLLDRQCKPLTVCTDDEFETRAATQSSDRHCAACRSCQPGREWEVTPCQGRDDRQCAPITVCVPGVEFVTREAGERHDRECVSCSSCNYASEYEATPCTLKHNRQCKQIQQCGAKQWESAPPTRTSDRQCAACRRCGNDEWQRAPCNAMTDTECAPLNECDKATEYQVEAPTATSDRICASHSECSSGQYETRPPGPHHDRECALKVCACPFGTAATGVACPRHGARFCVRCDDVELYALSRDAAPYCACSDLAFAHTSRRLYSDARVTTMAVGEESGDAPRDPWAPLPPIAPLPCLPVTECQEFEHEVAPPTATSDRVCQPNTVCQHGTEFESAAPTASSDRVCTTCTSCASNQFELQRCGRTSPRICAAVTRCTSTEFEVRAPTATSDRKCGTCSVCSGSEFVASPCGGNQDTQCQTVSSCAPGSQWQAAPPTPTSDRECRPCSRCAATHFEVHPCGTERDRRCQSITVCGTGEVQDAPPTAFSDRTCKKACSVGSAGEISQAESHTQGDDMFLKGAYLEVGMNKRGYYGTHDNPPPSFVAFSMQKSGTRHNGLNVIADHHKDGWDRTKHKLDFAGDYAMPGSPHESWMVGYKASGTHVQCAGRAGFSGCSNNFQCSGKDESDTKTGVLKATSMCENNDVKVIQTVSFGASDLFMRTQVSVEAKKALGDVRWMRNVDPDNDRSSGHSYTTRNRILGQIANGDAYTAVRAASNHDTHAWMALYTQHPNSFAKWGGFHNTDPYTSGFEQHGTTFSKGKEQIADVATDLMIKLGDLKAGKTANFDFYYVFDKTFEDNHFSGIKPTCSESPIVTPPHVTTLAAGEEGDKPMPIVPPSHVTSMMVGEEGDTPAPIMPPPYDATSLAVGEEGDMPAPIMTMAIGEGGGGMMKASTAAVGEE